MTPLPHASLDDDEGPEEEASAEPAAASKEEAGVTRREGPEGATAMGLRRRLLPPSMGLPLMLFEFVSNKSCLLPHTCAALWAENGPV